MSGKSHDRHRFETGSHPGRSEPAAAALSSGETQIVVATRVLLSDAKVVIIDEATCNLGPIAEATVEQAFIARPGTLIVAAHRISSAQ